MNSRKFGSLYIALAVSLCLLGCGGDVSPVSPASPVLGQEIAVATTTSAGTYTVPSGFYVSATWTVEPGTTFIMEPGSWIDVTAGGRIIARGTSDKPITFTSSKPVKAKGDWFGVDDAGNGSVYEYCSFEYAATGLGLSGSLAEVSHCRFEGNTDGLDSSRAASMGAFGSNAFVGNTEPLTVNGAFDVDDSNSFASNTNQRARFAGHSVDRALSLSLVKVPVFVDNYIRVYATMALSPGVVVSMAPEGWISVEASGRLTAIGTSAAPVRFVSSKPVPAPGDWFGIEVAGNASEFRYCEIGYADCGIEIFAECASLALENSRIHHNTVGVDDKTAALVTDAGTNTYEDNGTDRQ